MDAFPFTYLPLDLARKILEDAALVNKAECLAILRVSRLAHEWLEPILYKQVFLREPRETMRFASAITLRNNPSFFASRVKSLYLNQTSAIASNVALILQVCTGLHRLTIRGPSNGFRPNLSFEAFTRDMKTLRYLALPLGRIPNTNFCAVQSNVTHLTLESGKFGGFLDILEIWREVCLRCTKLSHVAFSMLAYPDDFAREDFSTYIQRISLAMPSSIEMVVMMIWAVHQVETARSLERDLAETAKNDPRFVFVTYDIAKRPSIPVQGLGLRSHTEKSENWGYLFNESEPDYLWTFAEHTRKTRDGMRT